MPIEVVVLADCGDDRGESYALGTELSAHLTTARDAHASTIKPFKTRGNHYHTKKKELIVVYAGCPWELHWDDGEGTAVHNRRFDGTQAILVRIPPWMSHAVTNIGDTPLCILSLSSNGYDPANPDSHRRVVSSPPPPNAD